MALATQGIELFRHADSLPITRFQVLGERCSGTNFVSELIKRNTSLTESEYLGWKHGFPTAQFIPRDTLPVIVFRSPIDWLKSMYRKPWHQSEAYANQSFERFLREPFETRIDYWLWRSNAMNLRTLISKPSALASVLQDKIRKLRGRPFFSEDYEVPDFAADAVNQMDRDPLTGEQYPNILALREAKTRGFLSYRKRECSYVIAQYEYVDRNPQEFLQKLGESFTIQPYAQYTPVEEWVGEYHQNDRRKPVTPSATDLAFIAQNANAELEGELGYSIEDLVGKSGLSASA